MRPSLVVLVSLAVLAALVLTGCASREAMHPISSYVVPDFSVRSVKTIGLIPIAERAGAEGATAKLLPLVEEYASAQVDYVFLSQEQVLGAAQKSGASEAYNALISAWQKGGQMAAEDVTAVGQAAGADALCFVEAYRWSKEWVAPNVEGQSESTVGVRAVLFGASKGEKLWEASDEQTLKSALYSPDSGIGTHVDAGGMVRTSSGAAVPEPPPIEEVAARVVQSIFRVFPPAQ